MRVVHEHGEVLAGVDGLEPPGHARHRRDSRPYRLLRDIQELGHGHRGEHVLDVEPAAQLDVQRQQASRRARDQRDHPALVDLEGVGAHVGNLARAGVGDDGATRLRRQSHARSRRRC